MRLGRLRISKVMPAMCSTCPFGMDGDHRLANEVLNRTIGKASQICHHPALSGKKETHLCRGARDVQLNVLCAMGLLTEPTDKAFQEKSEQLGIFVKEEA